MDTQERKEYMRAYSRKLYKKNKAAGICANCHVKAAVSGKTCCGECLEQKKLSASASITGANKDIYFELFKLQEGKCKICDTEMPRPMLDHDHKTGEVRGLLCAACNSGLGFFRDSSMALAKASDYVLTSRTGHIHKSAKKHARRLTERSAVREVSNGPVRVIGKRADGALLTD